MPIIAIDFDIETLEALRNIMKFTAKSNQEALPKFDNNDKYLFALMCISVNASILTMNEIIQTQSAIDFNKNILETLR